MFVKYSLPSISYNFEQVYETKKAMFEKKKAIMNKPWWHNPLLTQN